MLHSPNLKLSLVLQNQSRKELTVNEALIKIDALLNNSVIAIVNEPSSDVKSGDLYIVGSSPVPLWERKAGWITYYYVNNWYFIEPKEGVTLWLQAEEKLYTYQKKNWTPTISS